MLAGEIIKQGQIDDYIHNVLINKSLVKKLYSMFMSTDIPAEDHVVLMYLLYNEKLSIYEFFNNANIDGETNNISTVLDSLATQKATVKAAPYGNFRYEHFRDYVTTLDFSTYTDVENIEDQLNIVNLSVTDLMDKLNTAFVGAKDTDETIYLKDLVRYPSGDDDSICLSKIEQKTKLLDRASAILNDELRSTMTSDEFKYLLNKISYGTIH